MSEPSVSDTDRRDTLTADWEQDSVPAERPVAVEFTFTPVPVAGDAEVARLPLSLGLAIDRSGSMAGDKVAAARRAAAGVLDGLRDGERFAAAAFDTNVADVSESVVVDDAVRARLRGRILGIETGGTTALFGGFARAAELIATGSGPAEHDCWVLVLSDGMGNAGPVDPAFLRGHAAALAERGIRTISVGIGADYEAAQLTALSDGGQGEFHHASRPDEIVEIVLGELRVLRTFAARGLKLRVSLEQSPVSRWLLLGGANVQGPASGESSFDRVNQGRSARVVALVWPSDACPRVSAVAEWTAPDGERRSIRLGAPRPAPSERNIALALRAALLWQAAILARALELNEAGDYKQAHDWATRQRNEFAAYVRGLPGEDGLLEPIDRVAARVDRHWSSPSHREAYVMANKMARGKFDLREEAPRDYASALRSDDEA